MPRGSARACSRAGPRARSTPWLAATVDERTPPSRPRRRCVRVPDLARRLDPGVEAVRDAIARGDIYQANLTRRLEAPFDGDPWPLFRRLRTGDPALFAGFLDLGPSPAAGTPRALLSACPEPFLVGRCGRPRVSTDPIKGTRPRGRTREQDRALARELLASAKDQAENVMIVDVLRNDLGRVCEPGSVQVPRLLRLERTAAVQHLVTTVTGRLRAGRRRLRPARGRVPRRLDHRRAEDPGDGADRAPRAGPPRPVLRRARVAGAGRHARLVASSSGRSSRTANG